MQTNLFKRLLAVIFVMCFISCDKGESDSDPHPLDLSGYTGMFYCRYDKDISTPGDTGYAYIRVLQKPAVQATLIVADMGSDTTGAPHKSFEVNFIGMKLFQGFDPGVGCSHCPELDYGLTYVDADSIFFSTTNTVRQPVWWQTIAQYTGKRVK